MTTRRGLLAAGAGALAATLVRPAAAGAANAESDAVCGLILLEDAAVVAYERAAEATGDALLQRIGVQDDHHAHVLRVMLEALTVPPPHHEEGAERADPATARLARSRSRPQALAAAIVLEERLQAAYTSAAYALVQPPVLQTVAGLLGSHLQQLSALRAAAGRPPLTDAIAPGA